MAITVFLDTSVLLAGLIDFGPQSAPAQSVLHAAAEKQLANVGTAWHCCLECFSVATRLPAEFRLTPADAVQLLESEVFTRMAVHDLPPADLVWREIILAKNADRPPGHAGVFIGGHGLKLQRLPHAQVGGERERAHQFREPYHRGFRLVLPCVHRRIVP